MGSRRKSFRSFRNPRVQSVQKMGGLEIPLVLSRPSELEPHYHQHCPSASCWCAPGSGPQIQEGRPHLYSWGHNRLHWLLHSGPLHPNRSKRRHLLLDCLVFLTSSSTG